MAVATRFINRYDSYSRAFAKLEELVKVFLKDDTANLFAATELTLNNEIAREALIKRFEFTQELSWNLLKDYLQYQGETEMAGSRDTFRRALKLGIISDGKWMDTIVDRNLSAHDYNDSKAKEISDRIISDYYPLFADLLEKMKVIIANIPLSER